MNYPKTKKEHTSQTYFGKEVVDEYKWLEDENLSQTKDWIDDQNTFTQEYLEKIPFRDKLKEKLTQSLNYPKTSLPIFKGSFTFMFKNSGLQNHSILYKDDEVFLDPNTLSEDGNTSLCDLEFSPDNTLVAYITQENGSDWQQINIKNLKTQKDFPETLTWIKAASVAWYKDGFFYSKFEKPKEGKEYSDQNIANKIYYHTLGTSQSEDELIFENEDKTYREHSVFVDKKEKFLVITIPDGSSGDDFIVYNPKTKEFSPRIIGHFNKHHLFFRDDNRVLMKTNEDAPLYRVVEIDLENPQKQHWKEIVPQQSSTLNDIKVTSSGVITTYFEDVNSKMYLDNREIELPAPGSINSLSYDKKNNDLYFLFVSYSIPPTIFRLDLDNKQISVYRESQVKFNREEYTTKQVFYKSKDGTSIPLFITHKKNLKLDSQNPTLLYGYGGFNVTLPPHFKTSLIPFLEAGGVYAVANIRGGGEYGQKWHEQGKLLNKQNCFDDFIAAAEYLIKENYTSSEKLAIEGGSNGGLLVAACMIQRPDLFKVVLPAVGVLDMVKYIKFTDGEDWISDYGDPREEKHFNNLLSYSPYHNLKSVNYPATFVTTGDHDDRVVPAHSFKFISRLQELSTSQEPHLIRIDKNAGHGGGKPLSKMLDEMTDEMSFMFYKLGIKDL